MKIDRFFAGYFTGEVPFGPAIYEHKAYLIDRYPSEIAREEELLYQALREEFSLYKADLLTVGVDVYNVEAEALGCEVRYFEDSPDVPVIVKPILKNEKELEGLTIPDPSRAGRMPLILRAGKRIKTFLEGEEVVVRGAISGPFTLASRLIGQETLLRKSLLEPDYVKDLLQFCAQVGKEYGRAWLEAGLSPIVFDSLASPPTISPRLYRQLVLPFHKVLLHSFRGECPPAHLPLIIGGETTPIAEDIAQTGANLILCDYNADLGKYLEVARSNQLFLRVNLDPDLVRNGPRKEIFSSGERVLERGSDYPRLVLGTGVLPYDTPKENVLVLRELSA